MRLQLQWPVSKTAPLLLCLFVITLFSLVPVSSSAQEFEDEYTAGLYNSVLNSTFYMDKIEAGKTLGASGTPESEEALSLLLQADSYWDRTAAAYGIGMLRTKGAAELLITAYVTDFMIESEVKKILLHDIDLYKPYLFNAYDSYQGTEEGKQLLQIMAEDGSSSAVLLLKEIITNMESPDRSPALDILIQHHNRGEDLFIRGFIDDTELRGRVLDYLIEYGSSKDLPVFLSIIENSEEEYLSKAFQTVARWGSRELQEKIFLTQLAAENTASIYQALEAFNRPLGEKVMQRLIELTRDGPYQQLRTKAAERLINYNDNRIIPALIGFSREEYIASSRDGWDIFIAHMTFGLSALFNRLSEKQRKAEFISTQNSVLQKLRTLTEQ